MFALLVSSVASTIPVPKRLSGVRFGADPALINIEVFCDAVCPDCGTTWPIVESVLTRYPTQVGVRIHFLALPRHTWGYAVARGIFAVQSISEDKARDAVHALYVNRGQNRFSASTLQNTPESQVISEIISYFARTLSINATQLQAAYYNANVVSNTQIDYKYSFIRRIPGTPTVHVNGAQTTLNEESKLEDWTKLIDSLL
jgi:hypothetical protein